MCYRTAAHLIKRQNQFKDRQLHNLLFRIERNARFFLDSQSLYSKNYFYYSYWSFHKCVPQYTWLWSNQLAIELPT